MHRCAPSLFVTGQSESLAATEASFSAPTMEAKPGNLAKATSIVAWTMSSGSVPSALWLSAAALIVSLASAGVSCSTVTMPASDGNVRLIKSCPSSERSSVGEGGSLVASGDWSHTLLTPTLVSHDGGRTWQDGSGPDMDAIAPRSVTSSQLHQWSRTTGLTSAIRDACRINDSSLCAVGDHGVISLSRDNGRSWQAVRGEKRRTAILFISSQPTSVAWSLLGSESLEARHRTTILLHSASTSLESRETPAVEVAGQVCVMLGGSGADLIASRDADWGQVAMQWIDIHRPAAVVLDESLPPGVRDAFFQAATSSGVLRVVEYAFDGDGRTAVHRSALLPKSGVLASDLFADAMHYLAPRQPRSPSITLRYLYDAAPATRRGDSVVSGIPLESGQSLLAPPKQASRRQLQIVQARLSQSQRIANLIGPGTTTDQFAESLQSILDQTAKQDQFRLAWSILGQTRGGPGGHIEHLAANGCTRPTGFEIPGDLSRSLGRAATRLDPS